MAGGAQGYVSLVQLEAGLQTLGFPGLSSAQIRQALLEAGCDASALTGEDELYHHTLQAWGGVRSSEDDDVPWAMGTWKRLEDPCC